MKLQSIIQCDPRLSVRLFAFAERVLYNVDDLVTVGIEYVLDYVAQTEIGCHRNPRLAVLLAVDQLECLTESASLGTTNEGFNPLSVRCRRETPPGTCGIENLGDDSCLVNRVKCRFGHSMCSKHSVHRAVMHCIYIHAHDSDTVVKDRPIMSAK